MIVSIDGKTVPEKNAKVSISCESFLFGYAVFETIRTYNKKVFRLDDHLSRLYLSADIVGLKPKWGLKKTYKEVGRVLSQSKWNENKIRVILTEKHLLVMIEKIKEKNESMYKKGVKLISFPGQRTIPRAKTLADAFCYLAKRHALKCGVYEALLIEPKTYVRECAYANVFWVNNGKLYTTNRDILFGITRETVIDIAGEILGKVFFQGIKHKSLMKADEVFITQTTSGILPVVEIDGHKIGNGRPGPTTKKLMKVFDELVWG